MAQVKATIKAGMPLHRAADKYGVTKSTLEQVCHGKQDEQIGGQTVFTELEENMFCKYITTTADWGFSFSPLDFCIVVKSYLVGTGRTVTKFKENIPGEELAVSSVHQHKCKIGHTCQNIKSSRAGMQKEEFVKYFENLKDAFDFELNQRSNKHYVCQYRCRRTVANICYVQSNKYVEYVDKKWNTVQTM